MSVIQLHSLVRENHNQLRYLLVENQGFQAKISHRTKHQSRSVSSSAEQKDNIVYSNFFSVAAVWQISMFLQSRKENKAQKVGSHRIHVSGRKEIKYLYALTEECNKRHTSILKYWIINKGLNYLLTWQQSINSHVSALQLWSKKCFKTSSLLSWQTQLSSFIIQN